MDEAGIHFDFYHHIRNAIEDDPQRGQRTYERVKPEYKQNVDGRADLVLFDTNDDPALVIEAKRPGGAPSRDIDPYAPAVIKQAHGYASQLGTPYFATYNSKRLVLFNTHEEGVPLLNRSTKSYDIVDVEPFADTLLNEIARLEAHKISWDRDDEAFIKRMRTLHELLSPELEAELTAKLDADSEFREAFVEWANAQGIEYDDASGRRQTEVRERFAEEGAYLLANKVLFYKILEAAPAYTTDVRPLAIRPSHARADLEDYFEEIVENIDFEAIFEHDPIYGEIPLASVGDRINEFIDELDEQDLAQFNSRTDVIGRIYEGVIPAERRRELGEYYTPPPICDLITRLTIDEATDRVLDPACGSGGFPVSAYHRKRDLLAEPAGSHDRLLTEIYGIDINRFPAHLTAINLAIQDLSSHTEDVGVEVADFFNVNADMARFGRTAAGASGTQYEHGDGEAIGGFDAVVGNPPYIRQENIDDKDLVRDHLSNVDGEGLSKRSDIYSYFITHGTEFLSPGGRLGFITSDRWLDTQYGEDVQQFALDNYEIEAVIKFDNQVFDEALVDSSVLILQEQEDENRRRENVTKFLRLKQELGIEEIAGFVEQDAEADKIIENDDYRLVTRRQSILYQENKWNVFFFAPPLYFDLQANENVTQLSPKIAEVSRGITTGANDFFIGETEAWDDELEDYLTPIFKATGQLDRIAATAEDAEQWRVLDMHDFVVEALGETDADFGKTDINRIRDYLRQTGHDSLDAYIENGEQSGYHERSTLSGKDIWFDLGSLLRPRILSTMFTWRVHRVHWNEPEAATSDQFYYIVGKDDVDDWVLCAVLNSRITWLANELLGRRAGGQGMARLQTKVYETKQWPVPDPRTFTDKETQQIRSAFQNLLDREKELDEPTAEATEDERDELDLAIIPTLGFDADPKAVLSELKQGVDAMVAMRDEGAGERTTVLVERPQRTEGESGVVDLPGVSEVSESTVLSDYE